MSKIKRFIKVTSLLILGGVITHFIITPYLVGNFDDEIYSFKSFLKGEETNQKEIDDIIFNRIDKKLQRKVFSEFYDEYGEDAIGEYERYLKTHINNPQKNLPFNYSERELNNRANQMNPNNSAYGNSRNSGGGNQGLSRSSINNRANQMNPNNSAYGSSRNSGGGNQGLSRSSINNRANQMNPNNSAYGSSRNSGGGNQGLSRSSINNRANQMNPNNSAYRGGKK